MVDRIMLLTRMATQMLETRPCHLVLQEEKDWVREHGCETHQATGLVAGKEGR